MSYGHHRKNPHPLGSEENLAYLRKLMPLDLYLYEYAKQLFELRWQWYLNNVKLKGQGQTMVTSGMKVKLPQIIDGCKATKTEISCP